MKQVKNAPGPGGHGPAPVMRAKNFKGSMKQLLHYLGQYKFRLILVCLFTVLSTVFMIFGPKILGTATQEIVTGIAAQASGTGTGINFARIAQILLFLLGLYLVSLAFSAAQGLIMTKVSISITYDLRRNIMEKINRIPLGYFDSTNHGEVLSRVTNDVDTLSQTLAQSITQLLSSAVTFFGILALMFSISWQMTMIALVTVPMAMFFGKTIVGRSQKYFKQQQEYLGHVNGHVEEMYGGHTVVKAFHAEEDSVRTFEELNDTLYESAWKSQFLSAIMMPAITLASNIGYVAVCILGGYLAIRGQVNIGNIQAFMQYVRRFNQPISQVANISNVLQQTAAAAERVFEFLAEEEETPDTPRVHYNDAGTNGSILVDGEVTFSHVHFGYRPDRIIINDFNAVVRPGQKVAIVGPTGAGKTTMVKLLMRFYDLNSGSICIDGHNINDFARNELRDIFGMVLQDTWLYNDTIRENIRYGNRAASDEEVVAAAKAAQVDHFIRTLPGAYDMVLNEEASNISQGQKQLITIARAILSDPRILIFDEATSSVDTRTELLIQKAMDALMEGRTSFIIAHRLSTIRDADLILCMNNGDIVEQGTHEELLKKNGFYAAMYNSQFERVS